MLNSAKLRNNIDLRVNGNISKKINFEFTGRMSDERISGPSISSGRKLKDGVKYAPVWSVTSMNESVIEGEDDTSVEALSTLQHPLYDIENEYKEQ